MPRRAEVRYKQYAVTDMAHRRVREMAKQAGVSMSEMVERMVWAYQHSHSNCACDVAASLTK